MTIEVKDELVNITVQLVPSPRQTLTHRISLHVVDGGDREVGITEPDVGIVIVGDIVAGVGEIMLVIPDGPVNVGRVCKEVGMDMPEVTLPRIPVVVGIDSVERELKGDDTGTGTLVATLLGSGITVGTDVVGRRVTGDVAGMDTPDVTPVRSPVVLGRVIVGDNVGSVVSGIDMLGTGLVGSTVVLGNVTVGKVRSDVVGTDILETKLVGSETVPGID